MHSPPTKTNSWRCRQTRRKLISSPTRRGLQGEKGGREGGSRGRSGGIVFYSSLSLSLSLFQTHVWLAGLQAPHPSHSRSLPCHSQRHVSLYLPLPLSINLHLPHPPFLSSDGSLRRCLRPLRCCRCVTSSWAASSSSSV